MKKVAALNNPIADKTGKHPQEWFHGSPHDYEEFGDPAEHSFLAYEEQEPGADTTHWNTLLGTHFSADHNIAHEFSGGTHSPGDDHEGHEPLQHVVHAKLHLKNPKIYKSEHDMDQEVHEYEHSRGNTFENWYKENPESDPRTWGDDDEDDDWGDSFSAHSVEHYRDDHDPFSKRDADPRYGYNFHPKATGWLNHHPHKYEIAMDYKKRLMDQGHDGVVYGNEFEKSSYGGQAKSAIAFHPEQIEVTQHHYGQHCLTPKQADEQRQIPGQTHVPGFKDVSDLRRLPKSKSMDPYDRGWTKTNHPGWDPDWHKDKKPISGQRPLFPPLASKQLQGEDTGRLSTGLPAECWDRFHGRQENAQGHTAMLGDASDWDTYYSPDMQVHRGIHVKAPMALLNKLHDPEKTAEVAQELVNRTSQRKSTGMHWSSNLEKARDFGGQFKMGSDVPVILHGQAPAREDIETRPAVLKRNQVFDYHPTKGEQEVPLRKGAGVDVFGISWKPHETHPHADEHGWVRHDFTAPVRHTAGYTMKYTRMTSDGYEDAEREIEGPLYHGSRAKNLKPGDLIRPGRKTNPWGDEGAKSTHVYFTERHDTARSYADDAGGHVYEVEPTGDIKPDYNGDDYKSPHPLRVIRKVESEQRTAAQQPYGEQSALNEMGQQDVYAVRSGNTMVNLCQHHRDVHVGNSRAADSLGAGLGIGARERSAESLGGARKGSCAACGKDTAYQLKLLTPRSMQDRYREERQPTRRRQPYVPTKTQPLEPLRQSENSSAPHTYYHGTAYDSQVQYHPDTGHHSIHPDSETGETLLHPTRQAAWKHAIGEFEWDDSDFPRVHSVHRRDLPADAEPTEDGGLKTKSVIHQARAENHHSWEDPEIKLPHEKGPILYHGTTHAHENDDPDDSIQGEPLKSIDPGISSPTHGGGVSDPSYAYATPHLENAWHYADFRSKYGPGGVPHVYRVTPHKPEDLEEDPTHVNGQSRGNMSGDMRSKSGFKVLDDVPMPHKMKHEETEAYEASQNEDDDDDWGESHFGVKLAAWDDDDDEQPEECEECYETHTPSEGHRECNACGERHEDYEQKIEHEGSWTNWDQNYPRLNKTIHRALEPMKLPSEIHDAVHDESRPASERAATLLGHIERKHGDNIGMHWSDVRGDGVGADKFAGNGAPEGHTQVMLHAKLPEKHHIETDPDELNSNQVISYGDHDEMEVPISYGSPVHVTGVSWRPGGHGQQWRSHNLKEPIKMTASKKLPTLRTLAHDATENQAIRHCPFCGGGKVIGRGDGTVECEFCGSYFTVQVQPQFPSYPQTIGGEPQDVPGMPGDVETPGGSSEPGGFPGGDEEEEGGNPFAEDAEEDPEAAGEPEEEEEPPPFAKKSSLAFRTASGAVLGEDDYMRHLAIRLAPDRDAMIAHIREERRGITQ